MTDSTATPTADQIAADEAAALERAAAGLREALVARAVYCGTLGDDGAVRFRAATPVGVGMLAPLDLADHPDLETAVRSGVVSRVAGLGAPFEEQGESLVLPLTSRGATLGLAIAVMDPGDSVPGDSVLTLIGAKIGSTIAAIRDCGDLTRRVAGLHDAAALLDHLIDTVSDAVKIIDLDGRIVRWNPAAEVLYGWSEGEVLGEKMPYLPKDMRRRATQDIRAIAASGRIATRQASALHRSGTQFTVDIRAVPVRDGDGNPSGVMSVARRVSTEEHGHRRADDFAQAISREIKVPLTALVGYAQLLVRPEILGDSSRRARTIRALEGHGSALADLLDEAVAVSRLREGDIALDREPVDIAGLLADVVARFEESRRGQRIVVDFDAGSGIAFVDRRRIGRAIKAMLFASTCGYERTGEVAVSVNRQNAFVSVRVEVRCDARGSAGADDSADTGYATGLGLYLASLVAEAHGGSFETGEHVAKRIRWYCLRVPVSGDVR